MAHFLLAAALALFAATAEAAVGLTEIAGKEGDGVVTVYYPSSRGARAGEAAVGLTEIAGKEGDGVVTVYYPSSSGAQTVKHGLFSFQLAWHGAPRRGNGRLIVISHGSGGAPWVHADLARALVEHGFVVAMPRHRGDNYEDHSTPGPEGWQRRPGEVSRAIDAVGQDRRFGPLLTLDKVGMYGFSAGGHTALTLAGGRWSP